MAAWDLRGAAAERAAVAAPRRHARRDRVRRLDRHPGLARRARRQGRRRSSPPGYRRIKIKIKPGWDVAAVETDPRALRRHPADGRRQRRLHARRRRSSRARSIAFDLMMIEQPLDYDDVRDHAALQRRHRDADLPRRIDPHGPRRGGGDRARRLPHHQHQAGPRRRARASRSALHDLCARARHPGLARRHARERHRPRAQHPPGVAAELLAAGRHRRQPALLRARSDRAGHRGQPRRHGRGARRARGSASRWTGIASRRPRSRPTTFAPERA